jgi:hypothetical protein
MRVPGDSTVVGQNVGQTVALEKELLKFNLIL